MGVKPGYDFSGYATKAGLECADGRTITAEAFKHMDGKTVPLVWQHGRSTPDVVLGHAILEARSDGMYAYGYFNETPQGKNAKALVEHEDIRAMSIWANGLVEKLVGRAKAVLHGTIREVSLVLSGANPGALIDFVNIVHSDGESEILADEAIIYTGLEIEHGVKTYSTKSSSTTTDLVDGKIVGTRTSSNESTRTVDDGLPVESEAAYSALEHAKGTTLQDIYDSLSEEQVKLVHYMVEVALKTQTDKAAAQSAIDKETDKTAEGEILEHKEGTDVSRVNVFEKNNGAQSDEERPSLSHEDVKGIFADAMKCGSLKQAVHNYATQHLAHGIESIEVLFPEAKAVTDRPEWNKRRTEWVASVLNGTKKSPFSRVKSLVADLTHDDARAKGYIKGNLKKEEFFSVSKRVTTPTTVYKKQGLDRDDIIDITDFDVVAWLKAEMRMMLEEELARAILIGDGRDVSDEDKIKDPIGATEGAGIRSILHDHELYVTTVNVNIDDASSDYNEVVESVLRARRFYRGTGMPTFYTTEQVLTEMLLSKDGFGRRRWNTVQELAVSLRVSEIVPVEVMETEADLLGIIVNLADYNLGADRGGEVNFFDDFDIDFNKYKYLFETRLSGALIKIKAALVIKKTAGTNTLVMPTVPTFMSSTGVVTIPTKTGVVYKNSDGDTLTAGAQTALDPGASLTVVAEPDTGYYFATSADDGPWTFKRPAA